MGYTSNVLQLIEFGAIDIGKLTKTLITCGDQNMDSAIYQVYFCLPVVSS